MYLVTGLGNPGTRYSLTRHNAGFMLVDRLAAQSRATFERTFRHTCMAQAALSGHQVLLAKPQTFMNRSGGAVAELVRHFSIGPERLLVAYDEVALPLGKIRLRPLGSSGGHRGMQSIIEVLGRQDIPRLRIGVGTEQPPEDYRDYVLADFSRDDRAILDLVLDRACQMVETWICEGIEKAMSKFNG